MRIKRLSIGWVNQKQHSLYIYPDYHAEKHVILWIKASMCSIETPLNAPSKIVSKFSVVPEIQADQCVFSLYPHIHIPFVHS